MFKLTIALLIATLAFASAANYNGNYFHIRDSGVRCVKYPCPSFLATSLNNGVVDLPIVDVIFDESINTSSVYDGLQTGYTNVVVYGVLSTIYMDSNVINRINVEAAYRILPLSADDQATRSGTYYTLSNSGIYCITTPCPTIRANQINSEASQIAFNYFDTYNTYTKFDSFWLHNKEFVAEEPHKAIVQANIFEGTVIVKAVFANIKDHVNPCPPIPKIGCAPGYSIVYTRDANRCLAFDGCVRSGVCTLSIPLCNEGYSLTSHSSAPNGCPHWYCDAAFLE
ncbi:hypothetical protein SAMD00019534_006960 [Acytostelium subglobosum LB1]|uniref:hypothetical protein n=1 Tax=Acytostelium subglobosum LB1 TaxID=1410327 RepID=UPI000644D3E4|nr:hypothetical protein SAMD00019534_006960 [Acytostelium subglobosum LB1]GAM17521.1 hypothetical protein SAMD00019534_006960 [Acytostelium subglobosum LB1]|eukprot:XP_012759583.1 hypothetical protein SAMD00019534_006960 [Acytostelium subglobosum LB1]